MNAGLICLSLFVVSYIFIVFEEFTQLRKSKPAILGACLIWVVIALAAPGMGFSQADIHDAMFGALKEFAALFFFLLVTMTYVSALEEREVFNALRSRLIKAKLSYRQLFWITGIIAFSLSPITDNLTTAIILGAAVIAVSAGNTSFVAIACVNIVVASNAGGTFSPFGDITTLMVWQSGRVGFFEFFTLFVPSLVNFLIPALVMHFFISKETPESMGQIVPMKKGAKRIIALGLLTIANTIVFKSFFDVPAFLSMMLGLSLLMVFSWYLNRKEEGLNVFQSISAVEWDTLLYFFGIIFSIGGLAFLGYLEVLSSVFYQGYGPDISNIALGLLSSILGNLPLLFGVLQMAPQMDHFQWLLVTLTTGIGGSLLSIGSAASIGLMGVAKGKYTFISHLKWTPILLAGYAGAIATHYALN